MECNVFAAEIGAGKKAELRFRLEDAIFVEEKEENTIPVIVEMSTFEGGQYRVKVRTENGEGFCILHRSTVELWTQTRFLILP